MDSTRDLEARESLFKDYLNSEFRAAKAKNPSFSLRSFAKRLNVSFGALSEILNGKRVPSLKMAETISYRLQIEPEHAEVLIQSVIEERQLGSSSRSLSATAIAGSLSNQEKIDPDLYQRISDWHYGAILELLDQKGSSIDPHWISNQIGVSPRLAFEAIETLKTNKFIHFSDGRWQKSSRHFSTRRVGSTNSSLKKKQKDIRTLAIGAIDNVDIEKRSMTSVTFNLDPSKLGIAKRRIELFQREMVDLLYSKDGAVVYAMEIGLFPLQSTSKEQV